MSTTTLESGTRTPKTATALTETVYTICPVLVASHIAVHKGWLEKELRRAGGKLTYLWSLSPDKWLSHFNHTLPNQFRDGGNIPAIHARAEGKRTKLIGLTWSTDGGQILVRADSGIHRVEALRGKKIGLYKRGSTDRVDFWRATAERGILLSLDLAGLTAKDVEIVDLQVDSPDQPSTSPLANPAERFKASDNGPGTHYGTEIDALLRGKVDAIYANRGRAHLFQKDGQVKAINDLGQYPDWTLQVANSPYTITVSEEFALQHRPIVVAYLKVVARAGRWIQENRREAADIFGEIVPHWTSQAVLRSSIAKQKFVPSLSARNLAGVDVEKRFLLERGYIQKDFSVAEWADSSFLEEALAR
jgi:ABC-type nitrate/sulfonate/bicarbonate transport system substrate-binding protein